MSDEMLISRGPLLNYAHTPFYLPDPFRDILNYYPGSEWRFHSMKVLWIREPVYATEKRRLHDAIRRADSAQEAKRIGREEIDLRRTAWDKISYRVMLEANLAKFSQNSRARSALLGTRDKILVEHRPDPIWGDNMDGTGKNYMGKILMQVRKVLA